MTLEKIIRFQKKTPTELPLIKLTFYNTITKKQEEVEFYNYMTHLEKIGFLWVKNDLELRYFVELLTDKKKLIKKITMGRETRKKLFRNESTIWSFTTNTVDMTTFRGIIYKYFWFDDVVEE